ncbi:hypothetical protein COP2_028225 [Malus domestica]
MGGLEVDVEDAEYVNGEENYAKHYQPFLLPLQPCSSSFSHACSSIVIVFITSLPVQGSNTNCSYSVDIEATRAQSAATRTMSVSDLGTSRVI